MRDHERGDGRGEVLDLTRDSCLQKQMGVRVVESLPDVLSNP